MLLPLLLLAVLCASTASARSKDAYAQFMNQILVDADVSTQEFEDFLEKYPGYGYGGRLDEIVATDLTRVKGEVYLDYTGAGVYRNSQLDLYFQELRRSFFGNSHSLNPSSMRTTLMLDQLRKSVLQFFNTTESEYTVIFTSGATGSLRLVGDAFPWSKDSQYYYLQQNHNSVLGIREIAQERGAIWSSVSPSILPEKEHCHQNHSTPFSSSKTGGDDSTVFNLFAFPAEDNFAGVKYPLEWIELAHEGTLLSNFPLFKKGGNWKVLLDAAAFVPTNRLDLFRWKPDFVALSFYKMFGFPTGTGALLVKNDMVDFLSKRYFGGGTVIYASEESHYCLFHQEACSKFEDGTPNFLSILGIKYGFDALNEFGIDAIAGHVHALTEFLYDSLIVMKHSNGSPLVEVYGKHHQRNPDVQGCIVAMNLKNAKGQYIGYYGFQVKSAKRHIHVRTGCHCNPGACRFYLGVNDNLYRSLAVNRTSCGDVNDIIDERATGGIRVSMGYLTTFQDIRNFLNFVEEYLE